MYEDNRDGRGIGQYDCLKDTGIGWFREDVGKCTEKMRCGPVIPRKHEYIECGGIIALCGNSTFGWGSMKIRMADARPVYSIMQDTNMTAAPYKWYTFSNGVIFEQANALAEMCAKNN